MANPGIKFIQGDVSDLSFKDDYFDLITIVFGIRNVVDRKKALEEFFRVDNLSETRDNLSETASICRRWFLPSSINRCAR